MHRYSSSRHYCLHCRRRKLRLVATSRRRNLSVCIRDTHRLDFHCRHHILRQDQRYRRRSELRCSYSGRDHHRLRSRHHTLRIPLRLEVDPSAKYRRRKRLEYRRSYKRCRYVRRHHHRLHIRRHSVQGHDELHHRRMTLTYSHFGIHRCRWCYHHRKPLQLLHRRAEWHRLKLLPCRRWCIHRYYRCCRRRRFHYFQ